VFVPGTSSLKSRPCTSAFRRDRCSDPEFLISMPRTSQLLNQHHLRHHLFADDMQCYCSGRPAEAPLMVSGLERCIADVSAWCASRRQQLNGDETELL